MITRPYARSTRCPCPAHALGDPPRGDPWGDHPVAPSSPVGAQRASVSEKARRGGVQDAGISVHELRLHVIGFMLSAFNLWEQAFIRVGPCASAIRQ